MADPVAVVRTRGDAGALASVRQLVAPHRTESIDGLPPFQGGAAGYLAYDWGLTLERLPAPRFDDLGLDDVVIGLYDWVLAWDHIAAKAWLISHRIPKRRAARARAAQGARARCEGAARGGGL
jgi:para-aminobenzoate synthetase component 1